VVPEVLPVVPLLPSEPDVDPLLPIEEPDPLSPELDVDELPLPYELPLVEPVAPVEPEAGVPLLCVVVALEFVSFFLCFRSPIANAEPLARAMMEVTTNAGASLRIAVSNSVV